MIPPMQTDLLTHLPDTHRPPTRQERHARREARAMRKTGLLSFVGDAIAAKAVSLSKLRLLSVLSGRA